MTNEERDTMLQETHDAVITIIAEWAVYRTTVDELDESVRGNGRDGLTARVGKLEWAMFGLVGSLLAVILMTAGAWALGKF